MLDEKIVTEKQCSKCDKVKPLSDFAPHKRGVGGRQAACKECENARTREYKRTHPEIIKVSNNRAHLRLKKRLKEDPTLQAMHSSAWRNKRIKRLYNITQQEYLVIFNAQNGVCAICGKPEMASNQYGPLSLATDHSHVTGKVRGLLCLGCNRKLGILEDAEFVTLAEAYLERYSIPRMS